MKTPTIEFYQDNAQEYRWRLKHGNGKILDASSEGFASKGNAVRNFKKVRDAMLKVVLSFAFMLGLVGCNTAQQRTAYNTLYSVHAVTESTVDGYFTATVKGLASTNGIPQVSSAYNNFQKSFVIALDAAQFNTNALAPSSLQQESADVISLVGQFWKGH